LKNIKYILTCLLISIFAACIVPCTSIAEDQRFIWSEEIVGANHGSKEDTLNRFGLAGHGTDGLHSYKDINDYASYTITGSYPNQGKTFNYSGAFAAAIAANPTTPAALLIHKDCAVSVDTTVPATLEFVFVKGGSLTVATGKTVIITHIRAGHYQIFKGLGDVDLSGFEGEIDPEWFGIVGDTETNNLAALEKLETAVSGSTQSTVRFKAGTYYLTDNFTFNANIKVILDYKAIFKTLTAKTLTITNLEADISQHFTGTGTATINTAIVYPEWLGAIAGDATDDSAEISETITSSATGTIAFTKKGSYIIDDDITFPAANSVKILPQAYLTVKTARTVTMNSLFADISLAQKFALEGSGKVDLSQDANATTNIVYPEWWGIDGTADEVQINQAILSLGIRGGDVNFVKTYYTAEPIEILGIINDGAGDVDRIHLTGRGQTTRIISTSSTSIIRAIGADTATDWLRDIRVKDINVIGTPGTTQVGIHFKDIIQDYNTIDGCNVMYCDDKQIYIDHAYVVAIRNCQIGAGGIGQFGVYLENANTITVENVYTKGLSIAATTIGFYMDGCDTVTLTECRYEGPGGGTGFQIGANSSDEAGAVTLIGCGTEGLTSDYQYFAKVGVNYDGSTAATPARNIHFISCQATVNSSEYNNAYGFYIDNANGVTITGCDIGGGLDSSVHCTANAKNIKLGQNQYRVQYPLWQVPYIYSVNPDTIKEIDITPIWVPAKEFYDMNIADSTAPTAATFTSSADSQGVEWIQFPDAEISTAAANITLPGNFPSQRTLGGTAYWSAAPLGVATGYHTSGTSSTTVLTDSTKSWDVNVYAGMSIMNITDGSTSLITSNTATTITLTSPYLENGSDDTWEQYDAYAIYGLGLWSFALDRISTVPSGIGVGIHTAAGASTTVLTDSTKSWTINIFTGMQIRNVTNNAQAKIISNTATTITSAALSGGASWNQYETYTIGDITLGNNIASFAQTASTTPYGLVSTPLDRSEWRISNTQANDTIRITVRRSAISAGDTINAAAGLIGVMVYPVYHPAL